MPLGMGDISLRGVYSEAKIKKRLKIGCLLLPEKEIFFF
jgi:hypothetical protein